MINLFNKDRKVLVADINEKNKNGYTFTKKALESMYNAISEEKIFGQLGSIKEAGGIDLTKATHECHSPQLKDGKLYCKIKFLDTPYVEEALGYLKEHNFDLFTFKPEGTGKTDPVENIIYDYTLNSVNLFIESED